MQRVSVDKYCATAQLAHWLSALLVGIAWALGLAADELLKGGALGEAAETIHVWAGELIGLLLVIRLASRFTNPPPPAEPTLLGRWGDLAGKSGHIVLYALLAAVVAVGVATQLAEGEPLSLLGVFNIASPWVKDRNFAHNMKEMHEILANGLVALATVHAGAALLHHFVLGDRTLKRMLPGFFDSR